MKIFRVIALIFPREYAGLEMPENNLGAQKINFSLLHRKNTRMFFFFFLNLGVWHFSERTRMRAYLFNVKLKN